MGFVGGGMLVALVVLGAAQAQFGGGRRALTRVGDRPTIVDNRQSAAREWGTFSADRFEDEGRVCYLISNTQRQALFSCAPK